MPRYINREILQRETGWQFEHFEFQWLQYLIEKTGEIEFYLDPVDYFALVKGRNGRDGRTEKGEPYTSMYGIKVIMLCGDRLRSLRVLK